MTVNVQSEFKSREESKFLALLTRTQQKAARITGVARRTFANSSRSRKVASRRCFNTILNTQRSSSNESSSASSGNEKNERARKAFAVDPLRLQKPNIDHSSLSSHTTTDAECIDSSEEHLNNNDIAWGSIVNSSFDYDWRLPKYVEKLEQWLQDLEKHPQGPKKEILGEYRLKVEFLRKVVTTLEDEKREFDAKHLMNTAALDDDDGIKFPRRKTSLPSHRGSPSGGFIRRQVSPVSSDGASKNFSVLPHGQASTADIITKQIHQKLEGRHATKLRDELFGGKCEEDINNSMSTDPNHQGNLQTGQSQVNGDGRDLDDLLQAHHTQQEKVAEEMLSLTRSLKEQTRVAGEIVRKDTQVMERSNQQVEANTAKLQVESDRLADHTGSACRCWVWFLLAVVCFTFIAMVMVMKIFSKRKHDEL